MKFNALFVFALALLSIEPTPVAGKRLIVQLSAPPLAKHHMYATLRRRHVADRAANGDEISSVLGPLRELVSQQQRSFLTSVADKWPVVMFQTDRGARPATVHRLLNAVTIRVPEAEVEHAKEVISQMPSVVAVFEEQKYTLNLHTSRSAIGAPEAWAALNSTERTAGKGIKIAVVDAGIYTKADMFSDTGMELPTDGTYPQGDISNTNKKVIVSRMYIDPDDPPASYDGNSYPAATSSVHGIHCASTAAGSPVTTGSTSLNLTGVAPGAWLMNYRIFYNNRDDDSISASDSQILKALDDLTADGADVASNSWGSEAFYENTPTDLAMKAMSEAGVVTVVSAGNSGPNTLTVQKYNPTIRVGATTSGSGLSYYVMTSRPSVGYNIQYLDSQAIKTEVYGSYTLYGPEEDDELACSPLKRTFDKSDNVAVVALRGSCSFIDKITNIANAGASLAIIGNHREGGYDLVNMATTGVTINAVFVGHEPAMDLINLTKKSTLPNVTLSKSSTEKIVSVEKDILASFSSRGPTADMQLAPDVCAPGVSIYAAGYGPGSDPRVGYGEASGTSMSCPHVSGAAALILAKHPEFTPSEVTSALMSTANYLNVLDHDGTPAQPLEMGAGRIDLEKAIDPKLFIDPPSLSFSLVSMDSPAGSVSKTFAVKSYADTPMTLRLRAVHHTGRGEIEDAPSWVRIEPSTIDIEPLDDNVNVTVFIEAASGTTGDEQGYILIEDANGAEVAHLPYWARITFKESERVDVYVIDADQSSCGSDLSSKDYLPEYTAALDTAKLTYKSWAYCEETDLPIPTEVLALKSRTVLLFTGDYPVDLSNRDGEIREIMHSGVPVFQMGAEVGYSWGLDSTTTIGESPNIKREFRGVFDKTIREIKSISAGEEYSFNTLGILSVIGIECINDKSARAKLLKAFYDYSTETIENYTLSYEETEPYYTVNVLYNKKIKYMKVGWGDGTVTGISIKSKSEGSLEHAYQKKGVYYPRVVISTEVGGYFELDTNGKSFVVLEDHPEVSGSSAIKSSSVLVLLVSLIVAVFF